MKKQKEKNQEAIVLEISGEKGNLDQYKEWLCEASLLHIDKVIFCSVYEDEEETAIHYIDELVPVCKSLRIAKLSTNIAYAGELFDGEAVVVTLDAVTIGGKRNLCPRFCSLVSFDEYKKDKGIEIAPEEVQKVFAKLK